MRVLSEVPPPPPRYALDPLPGIALGGLFEGLCPECRTWSVRSTSGRFPGTLASHGECEGPILPMMCRRRIDE